MSDRGLRTLRILTLLLLVMGAWRMFALALHTPMIGYANQFDMARTSACIGLWPDLPPPAHKLAHAHSPIRIYRAGETDRDGCYWSTEAVLAGIVKAVATHTEDGVERVDLRHLGMIKALLLALTALALHTLLRRAPTVAAIHAAAFALVLTDPGVTLYLNTLYTEFTSVLFTYAMAGGLIALTLNAHNRLAWVLTGCGVMGLGLARQQHLLLPLALLIAAVPWLWHEQRKGLVLMMAGAVCVAWVQARVFERHASIPAANNTNLWLGAILPTARDPEQLATHLGLSPQCRKLIGATWYVGMGEDVQVRCGSELVGWSRARIVQAIVYEPLLIPRVLLRGVPHTQSGLVHYLGWVEAERFAGLSALPFSQRWSVFVVHELTPLALYAATLLATLAGAAVFWLRAALPRGETVRASAFPLAIVLLSTVTLYAFATSILGDGFAEAARHFHLGLVALLILVPLLIAGVARWLAEAGFVGQAVTAFLLLAIIVTNPIRYVTDRSPMAAGVVDQPVTNRLSSAQGVTLRGWAIDPFQVARVEVVNQSGQTVSTVLALPVPGAAGEGLWRYYPAFPGTGNAGFAIAVPPVWLQSGRAEIKTVAVNARGTRTMIDQRTLVVKD